jgi:hypothetical protein
MPHSISNQMLELHVLSTLVLLGNTTYVPNNFTALSVVIGPVWIIFK